MFLKTILGLTLLVFTITAQDETTNCLTLYEDSHCLRMRGSSLPGKPKLAQVCSATADCVTTAPDFIESYRFQCGNESYIEAYSGTHCQGTPLRQRFSVEPGKCTLIFTGSSISISTYGILGCDIVPEQEDTTAAFYAAFGFNCLLGGIAIVVYFLIKKRFPSVYEPRAMSDVYHDLQASSDDNAIVAPLGGVIGWCKSILRLSDDEVYAACGLDAAMYTMFYRRMFWLFVVGGLYSSIVIVPVNVHGREQADGVEQLSLVNIRAGSGRVWVHWIGMWLFSFGLMFQLNALYKQYVQYRIQHLNAHKTCNSIVLVQDIPLSCSDDRALAEYYSDMYPDVVAACRIYATDDLESIARKRQLMALRLEQAQYKSQRTGQRSTTRVGGIACCGGQVLSAEDHYRRQLNQANYKYAAARKAILANPVALPAGFVAFRSHRSATLAAQAIHSSRPHSWTTWRCPEPNDIVFDNLEITTPQAAARTAFVSIATGALVVLWIVPATLVASITTLETLDLWADGLEAYQNVNPIAQGIVQGVIPTVLLLLFMSVLPFIMQYFSHKEGIVTKSEINRSAMTKLVWFQMINVYAVSIIAGSILDIAGELSHDPRALWELLGQAIPRTGTFFTTYVMLRGLSGYPLLLLRAGEWIGFAAAGLFSSHTPREKQEFRRSETWDVSLAAADYVYLPPPQSGGLLWPTLFNRLIVALIIAQLTFTGVLSVKEAPTAASTMIVLMAITFWFWHRTSQGLESVGLHLPLEIAVKAEDDADTGPLSDYIQPVLRQSDELTLEQLSEPALGLEELPHDTIASRLYYDVHENNESGIAVPFATPELRGNGKGSAQKLLPNFDEP
eukprot:TRINITY_DN11153_c0_g1_i2.p1 TRINITY_DN11153_c0_g1~~TRINITY_DN11153_c0_g1_i2.p1  ORF type:complete len:844 (+),score=179.00 TRINITY_DN11153_c0_g1_i2:133-2664(+)